MKGTIHRALLAFVVVLLISVLSLRAQTDTVYSLPYSQGFESGLDGWTAVDYNNDGFTWNPTPYGTSGIPPHNSSTGFVGSSSFVGGTGDLTPDDFLVSPSIAVTSSAVLSWWFRVGGPGYPADHYSVYISTAGSTVADFLATTPVISITPNWGDASAWTYASIDLSAYVGDTITIAFRHHECIGQFALLIDDVTIEAFTSPWMVSDMVPWGTTFDMPDTGWTFLGRSNGWYIGTPGGLSGSGMYVSGDGGATNSYNKNIWNSRFHWAVRPLHFSDTGDYRVDYDWRADGYVYSFASTVTYYDHIRMMLAPVTAELDTQYFFGYGISTYTNNLIPAGWISLSDANGRHLLADSPDWTHHAQSFHIPAAGDYLLLVLAVNGNSISYNDTPPAIDNLSLSQISCYNSIDTLRLTANSNQGITVSWDDFEASQWAVYVNDTLYGTTSYTSFFLADSALNAATCSNGQMPLIGVSPVCIAGDTALPFTTQAVWRNALVNARTVSCERFTLPYGEHFDSYRHDDKNCFGWHNLGEVDQYIENYQSHSGSLSLNMRAFALPSGNSQLLVTPRFDAPGNRLLVSFWAKLPAYSGATTDTLFQAGVLFNHDTMDYAHVSAAAIPMLTLRGSDANNTWVHYQFATDVLADTTSASITFSLVPHGFSVNDCYIDDIEVVMLPGGRDSVPPMVAIDGPTQAIAAVDTARFSAILLGGDTAGLAYYWRSSLTGQSSTGGSQWSVVFSRVGVDTITVIASNPYGNDTAEHRITVSDNMLASIRGAMSVYTGDTLHYVAALSGPDTLALSFSWHSSMAAAGQATMAATGRTMTMVYSVNGWDTLTLHVTNSHGLHTVTSIVYVQSCSVISTFPYSEDFENYGWQNRSACWMIRTPEGLLDNEWRRTNAGANGSPYCMYSNGNATNRSYNAWLITPSILFPANADSITFGFALKTQYLDHFAVLVSPSGDPYYDGFTDTIYSLSGTGYNYNWDSVSMLLDAYRGRRIRIAFVHSSVGGSMGTVRIDNLRIDLVAPPVPDTVWRTVSVAANVEGACEPFGSGRYADRSTVEVGFYLLDTLPQGGHWEFLGWDDGVMQNPRSLYVLSDTTIVAMFQWIEDSVGIWEIENSEWEIEIYPNPSHGDVTVRVGAPATLTIIDITGRTVLPPTSVSSTSIIPHSALPPGVYLLRITADSGTVVRRLVKK